MKQHLSGMHAKMAEHHTAMAKACGQLSKCLDKAQTAEAKDSRGAVEAMQAQHEQMATFHSDSADACAKGAEADLHKLVPTQVSGIAPTPPGVTAVPRAGAPSPATIAQVNPAFAKLLEIDESDDWRAG